MRGTLPILVALAVAAACVPGGATTYNTPSVDGHVAQGPPDWDADEWGVDDPVDDGRWYPSDPDLDDLYVTWDADSLYVGMTTDRDPGEYGNGYLLFIDTDAQNGITGATDFGSADFYRRRITFSTMGADVIVAGWNLPRHFDVMHCSDPTNTSPVDGAHTEARADSQHIEAAMSWDGLFDVGRGQVPPGTRLRFIAAVVGGDDSGAYDAMPSSTTGIESNPATAWDAYTDLDVYHEVIVDYDWDGVPDEGFPPEDYPPDGSISGIVTLDDAGDTETVAKVTAWIDGHPAEWGHTPPGGGSYTIEPLYDGDYEVVATAYSYLDSTGSATVEAGAAVTGVDFLLNKVEGAIIGEVALSGGPSLDVVVTAYDSETGGGAGDGPQTVPGGTGAFRISTVLDGTYRVEAAAKGYEPAVLEDVVVQDESTADVGLLTLPAVVATQYAFVDSTGSSALGIGTTVSLPADTVYYYAKAWLEPRDDEGRTAYWDEGAQDSVLLSASSLDPSYPADGAVTFADHAGTELAGAMLTAAMFDDGRAPFAVASDSIQVLRVLASRGEVEGVLEVGIDAPAPVRLRLTPDTYTIAAGTGSARIVGQLIDAAGNDAKVPGVVVGMTAEGVGGRFSVSLLGTDANGRFEVDFFGTTSGTALVSGVIDPASPYAALDVDVLSITIEPGTAALVRLSVDSPELHPGQSAELTAQVADGWGNAVDIEGLSIALTATPSHLLAALESPIETGADGSATALLTAGPDYGIVEITGSTGSIPVAKIFLPIDATFVDADEVAPESDDDHNSLDGVDLTVMRAANGADELVVTLEFASSWTGVHTILLLETAGDAAGGSTDPFGFPVYYGHGLLPDYVFTYKYSYDDDPYADLRRYDAGQWWHYDFVNEEWRIGWAEGVNAVQHGFIVKLDDRVEFRLPLTVIEAGVGDTVRLEAYVTQQEPAGDGEKRTALDSVPHDATHDMVPAVGEWWETATTPVTLTNYATYTVRDEAPPAPLLTGGASDPFVARPGDPVTYTVEVTDAGGGVGDVFIDLSDIGGDILVRMLDDGAFPDDASSDGVYTAADTLTKAASDGDHAVSVTARDASNVSSSTLDIAIVVDNPAVALRSFADPVGDDHGPNQTDFKDDPVEGLYYDYPTNFVFLPGSFDLTGVDIFADGNWLVFRVRIDDLANHQDPGAADWEADEPDELFCDDPYRTDLNLQKIDIYIDAREGEGATSGFPKRYVDIAAVDAWDYGIAVEGWGKWFVVSNGENSTASWELFKNSDEIVMCDNHVEDYIDISVDRELLGLPADADTAAVRSAIAAWDLIVCMSSHDQDGDPEDQILGGIRRVDANTSEWQIGGGRDTEGGRERDANLMDVVTSAGTGHEPGRAQEEMLDYTTPEAMERFANDQVACVLEASFAVDTSPPLVIPFVGDPDVEHIPWTALDGAPAVIFTTMIDVTGIAEATFYWNPDGLPTLVDSVAMMNLTSSLWAADILREDIAAHTNVVELLKTGDARVIEGWIRAVDSSPAANAIRTRKWAFGLPEPWPGSQVFARVDSLLPFAEDETFIFQDGTILVLEAGLPAPGDELNLVLETIRGNLLDLSNIRDDMAFAGVARSIRLETGEGSVVPLDWPAWLLLHYHEDDVTSLSEEKLGIFSWIDETERWVLAGGAPNPAGNTVLAVGIEDLGVFGVFHWDELGVGDGRGLSGVLAEPNPFSPNGDGLYEETTVTFYLGRAADYVNIEFYDLTGRLARRLVFQEATNYSGRTPIKVTWDGTDENGNVVPYGIYVMRVEAKFKTEPTFERVNRPVVVIK